MIKIRETRTGSYWAQTSRNGEIYYQALIVNYRLSIDGKLIDSFLSKRAANRAKRRLSK